MTDHPLPLKSWEVRAILDGRKTQTRNIIRPQPLKSVPRSIDILPPSQDEGTGQWGQVERIWRWAYGDPVEPEREVWRPLKGVRWTVGDRLWVRETWTLNALTCGQTALYKADGQIVVNDDDSDRSPWRPSIHMPRWASRITLRVTGVRVERLQAISEEDAIREGVEPEPFAGLSGYREGVRNVWNHIHGPDAWDANPWVSVTSFERIEG